LLKEWNGFPAEAADFAVRQDGFQTVAHFYAVPVVLNRKQDYYSTVRGLVPNPPFLVKIRRVTLDVGSVQRVDGDYGDLRVSFLIDLPADVIQLRDGLPVKDVSEVVDVVSGVKLRNRFRAGEKRERYHRAHHQ